MTTKKCKKGYKSIKGVCVNKNILSSIPGKDSSSFLNNFLTILGTTVIVGFGWLAVRGFTDLSFLANLSPVWRIVIGVIGALATGFIFKLMFDIRLKK